MARGWDRQGLTRDIVLQEQPLWPVQPPRDSQCGSSSGQDATATSPPAHRVWLAKAFRIYWEGVWVCVWPWIHHPVPYGIGSNHSLSCGHGSTIQFPLELHPTTHFPLAMDTPSSSLWIWIQPSTFLLPRSDHPVPYGTGSNHLLSCGHGSTSSSQSWWLRMGLVVAHRPDGSAQFWPHPCLSPRSKLTWPSSVLQRSLILHDQYPWNFCLWYHIMWDLNPRANYSNFTEMQRTPDNINRSNSTGIDEFAHAFAKGHFRP